MTLRCDSCKKLITQKNPKSHRGFSLRNGAILIEVPNQATKIKCVCGLTMILLKGQLG